MKRSVERRPDVCIVGAGIIGLSLALELDRLGVSVRVLERDTALVHASTAAAGMLASDDPENPPHLHALSALSIALYPGFLARIHVLSGMEVPYQTAHTFQAHHSFGGTLDATLLPELVRGTHRFNLLSEHSIDPRQLGAALLAAVRQTSIDLREHTSFPVESSSHQFAPGPDQAAGCLIDARGAWSIAPVAPRKGQMLSVRLPLALDLRDVVRTPEVYIVPRTLGPRAGTAVIGATVEDAGFDIETRPADLAWLRARAADLLPSLGDERLCPTVDQWAGLRPGTPDLLPILGPHPAAKNTFVATGHYRNGILLAPATAHVMAQLVCGAEPSVDLALFAPDRFLAPPVLAPAHRYSATPS